MKPVTESPQSAPTVVIASAGIGVLAGIITGTVLWLAATLIGEPRHDWLAFVGMGNLATLAVTATVAFHYRDHA